VPIGTDEIRHLAGLAQLELDESAIEALRDQLQTILDYVDRLRELELEEGPADTPPEPRALREDRVRSGLRVDEALENAPEKEDDLFRVPRILDR
jgi:aspartyl-tRNA(Asn)/glutamyl-tRNA(Gln) amidotransferase subunit C